MGQACVLGCLWHHAGADDSWCARLFAWTCTLWLGATVLPSLMLCKAASAVHRGSCKPCRRVALAASTAIDVSCRQPVYGALAVELQLMVVII